MVYDMEGGLAWAIHCKNKTKKQEQGVQLYF